MSQEHPRFVSITGKPEMIALLSSHTASVGTVESTNGEGTPLHPRFHRAAAMKGCVMLGLHGSVTAEVVPARDSLSEMDRIVKAIGEMAAVAATDGEMLKQLFTNDGKPDANALASRVGFKVTASQRDEGWDRFNAGKE